MKFINKGVSPAEFEAWKKQDKPTSWSQLGSNLPINREEGIVYYSKNQLRTILYQEQYGLCCYCNSAIKNDHSSTIDHLEPREGDTQTERIFDYNNLVLSCNGGQKGNTNPKVLHCDANKKSETIELTPLISECETEIHFNENGEIHSNSERGIDAIGMKKLNLVNKFLDKRRANVIIPYIYQDFDNDNPVDILPIEELRRSFAIVQESHHIEYWSAIISVLKGYV